MTRPQQGFVVGTSAILLILGIVASQLPAAGAGALLHTGRRPVVGPPPPTCSERTFAGDGVSLRGWQCRASAPRRGTLVYLHGVADNRTSGAGIVDRFGRRGFDVIAYDSRAHGESEGDVCTYGYFEKSDLYRVLDAVDDPGPIVLIGTSLGAAVALQEASQDRRVVGVVAAETFSDLRTVATERAPFFFTRGTIARAFDLAERGRFRVDAVSPVAAASTLSQPVLLIHGAADFDTPPSHSQRVLAALTGPKQLILVPGAGHNGSLRAEVWPEIERWVDAVLARLSVVP